MNKKTLSKKILTQINVNPRKWMRNEKDGQGFCASTKSWQVLRDLSLKVNTTKIVTMIREHLKSYEYRYRM